MVALSFSAALQGLTGNGQRCRKQLHRLNQLASQLKLSFSDGLARQELLVEQPCGATDCESRDTGTPPPVTSNYSKCDSGNGEKHTQHNISATLAGTKLSVSHEINDQTGSALQALRLEAKA